MNEAVQRPFNAAVKVMLLVAAAALLILEFHCEVDKLQDHNYYDVGPQLAHNRGDADYIVRGSRDPGTCRHSHLHPHFLLCRAFFGICDLFDLISLLIIYHTKKVLATWAPPIR